MNIQSLLTLRCLIVWLKYLCEKKLKMELGWRAISQSSSGSSYNRNHVSQPNWEDWESQMKIKKKNYNYMDKKKLTKREKKELNLNWFSDQFVSVIVYICLIVRLTNRTRTKVGYNDRATCCILRVVMKKLVEIPTSKVISIFFFFFLR